MTIEIARAYIEISRREHRRKRTAILATLGISATLSAGLVAIGWAVATNLDGVWKSPWMSPLQ